MMETPNNGGESDIVTASREVLVAYTPKVPCPVCGAEAIHKMNILERVWIVPPNVELSGSPNTKLKTEQ